MKKTSKEGKDLEETLMFLTILNTRRHKQRRLRKKIMKQTQSPALIVCRSH